MKNKILILHFPSMNNYGTGMMGINAIYYLQKFYGEKIDFYIEFAQYFDIKSIDNELYDSSNVHLISRINKKNNDNQNAFHAALHAINLLIKLKSYRAVLLLGGDDFSEYYRSNIWISFCKIYAWSLRTPVILLGQTIGPFKKKLNRMACRFMLKNCYIFARDQWTLRYLIDEFSLNNVRPCADLAFLDLPKQNDHLLCREVLDLYGLNKNQYITIIVSALVGQYYTDNMDEYLNAWRKIIRSLLCHESLKNIKICLLAHTFHPFGEESNIITEILEGMHEEERAHIVPIVDMILPTKARLVLGNGIFTISGRMHASISTFQMGKPAISLSYSKKFEGIVGKNLDMYDLIIDANNKEIWRSDIIVEIILNKVDYVLKNYDAINTKIVDKISEQKTIINESLKKIIDGILLKR